MRPDVYSHDPTIAGATIDAVEFDYAPDPTEEYSVIHAREDLQRQTYTVVVQHKESGLTFRSVFQLAWVHGTREQLEAAAVRAALVQHGQRRKLRSGPSAVASAPEHRARPYREPLTLLADVQWEDA